MPLCPPFQFTAHKQASGASGQCPLQDVMVVVLCKGKHSLNIKLLNLGKAR